jgi:RimJ/RimL family protein N-acetyltransferase
MPGDTEMILTTERLVLRRLRADEAGTVTAYKNDPDVNRYQDWDMPYRVMDIAAKIEWYGHQPWPCPSSGLHVAIEHNGELIGDFGVSWDDAVQEAEIGYTLRLEHQGKGFATEALAAVVDRVFSEGVQRVTASLDPENAASIRVLEKVGFHYEASSRVEIRGKWTDDDVYVLSQEDRAAQRARSNERPR